MCYASIMAVARSFLDPSRADKSTLDETEGVAVGILDVHFSTAPSLVDGMAGIDLGAFVEKFGVKGIDVIAGKDTATIC